MQTSGRHEFQPGTGATITAMLAVFQPQWPIGAECTLEVSGKPVLGRAVMVSWLNDGPLTNRSHPAPSEQIDRSHWSRLSLSTFELCRCPSCALEPSARARPIHIERIHEAKPISVAAGFCVPGHPGLSEPELASATRGVTIWLTGLSGAGKSTIAQELERRLQGRTLVEPLDGDTVRTHLCKGLGFSAGDRKENVRRLTLAAEFLADAGALVIISAISPYRESRLLSRARLGRFIEVYVNAPLATCERRDVRGLYKRVRSGELKSFTGIDDPYEPPLCPEVECRTDIETVEQSVARIVRAIELESTAHCNRIAGSVSHVAGHDHER